MTAKKVYEGRRSDFPHPSTKIVTVNGELLYNYAEPDVRSEDAFEWGYTGGGPRVLAVSIVCDYFDAPKLPKDRPILVDWEVPKWYFYLGEFEHDFVKRWPYDGDFRITSDEIEEWIATRLPYDGTIFSSLDPYNRVIMR